VIDNPTMDDRIFEIKPKEGTSSKSSTGLVDNRLFKGGNVLHAYQDAATCLWYLKYEIGGLPEGLKDIRFTRLNTCAEHVRKYFDKRGLIAVLKDKYGTPNSNS
jgi:hypothetical protein